MISAVGASALAACSITTGAGRRTAVSRAAEARIGDELLRPDSFGRTVIVPAQLGSVSSGRTVPFE